jgi:hypothetical protein
MVDCPPSGLEKPAENFPSENTEKNSWIFCLLLFNDLDANIINIRR